MTRLFALEGHGQRRRHGAEIGAAVAMDAGRHVDRDHGQTARGGGRERRRRGAVELPAEAGTENRVDHQRRPFQHVRLEILDRTVPSGRMRRRIARKAGHGTQQAQAYRPAARSQVPGHDEAVAAIVARSAQHGDRLRRETGGDSRRHRRARALHQRDARHAAGNRQSVDLTHLGCRQKRGRQDHAGLGRICERLHSSRRHLGTMQEIDRTRRARACCPRPA